MAGVPKTLICRCPSKNGFIAIVVEQLGPFTQDKNHSHDATNAAADNGKRDAEELCHCAGFNFSQLRPALKENLIHAGHPPTQRIGGLQLANGIANDSAERIGGAGGCQGYPCQGKGAAQPKDDRRQPKGSNGAKQQATLPPQFMDLRDNHRSQHCSYRLRCGEPAIFHHANTQNIAGNNWHERIRGGKKRSDKIQKHGGENNRFRANKLNSLTNGAPADTTIPLICFLRNRPDQDQSNNHSEKRSSIEVINRLLPSIGNHQPTQCRANHRAGLKGYRGQTESIGQIARRDQVGNQRLACRAIKCHCHRLKRRQHVNMPEGDMAEFGEQAQGQSKKRRAALGNKQNGAPVIGIGQRTPNQRKENDRQNARQPNTA